MLDWTECDIVRLIVRFYVGGLFSYEIKDSLKRNTC